MPPPPIRDDEKLAAELAAEAGRVLLDLRAKQGFGDPKKLKAAGDREAHEYLMRSLAAHRPDDAVLSEEGVDDARRLDAPRVWIVDPLDGTREFSEEGRTDWAVHVALWELGELTAGAVAMPARNTVLTSADPPRPVDAEGEDPAAGERPLRLAVSRTRPPELTGALAASLGAELVPMGSAGVKIGSVLLGEADAYVHGGGQYEWDSAAPVAVARAAGVHASRLDGSPLLYNRKGAWLPDLVVCRASCKDRVLPAIQEALTHPTKES
ncbi:3'(2'),5'-bisphosphate nucleotidase CysQ [Streptomyces sp. NPDC054796]